MPKHGSVLLYVHRNRKAYQDGSPERPPRLSHSPWTLPPPPPPHERPSPHILPCPHYLPPCWPCEDDSCSWEVRTSEERCCGKPSIPCDAIFKLPESAMWVWGPYPGPDKPPPVVDVLVTIPLLTALTWTQEQQ